MKEKRGRARFRTSVCKCCGEKYFDVNAKLVPVAELEEFIRLLREGVHLDLAAEGRRLDN